VHIAAVEGPAGEAAKKAILGIVKEPEVGEVYIGTVVGIKDFGAFVKLTPSKDGLLHISRMANGRVGKVEDVLNIGDRVKVQVIEVGENGKISLDRIDKPDAPESSYQPRERRDRRDDRRSGDRRSDRFRGDRDSRSRDDRGDRNRNDRSQGRHPGDRGGRNASDHRRPRTHRNDD
jgi:polyribonucleotide nucleotidyltransferase